MAFQFAPPFPHTKIKSTLMADLTTLALTTNLKLVLDASDSSSYAGGTKWLDRSGNGYDFFLGADGSATSTDPTFNGSSGGQSDAEYFSFDGGDYFKYDTTNETWMDNLHKNNALFTCVSWVYFSNLASIVGLFGTGGNAIGNSPGISFRASSGNLGIVVLPSTGIDQFARPFVVPINQWVFVGCAVDEAANTIRVQLNGTSLSTACTYTNPSASSAAVTMEIGSRGNANQPLSSGSRMAGFAMWEGRALTAAEMLSVYTKTASKF